MAMARLSATRVSRRCFDAAELTNCSSWGPRRPILQRAKPAPSFWPLRRDEGAEAKPYLKFEN